MPGILGDGRIAFKDQELILRFFAMFFYGDQYSRPMKVFLNRYMATNRNLRKQTKKDLTELFQTTINGIHSAIGSRAFRLKNAINAAVFDSVMVGLAQRVQDGGSLTDGKAIAKQYRTLLNRKTFLEAVERATADEESVRRRLKAARDVFTKVK